MREAAFQWIAQHGYAGIFSLLVFGIVGLPVPDEWLLTFSGYLVFKQTLRFIPTFAAAFCGSSCGITVSYALGRISGKCIERWDSRGRLQTVRRFFERFGRWTLVFGYLVPGIRNVAGLSAGASKLRLGSFAPFAFAGAAVSSIICVTFGYVFGPQAEWIFLSIQRNLMIAVAAGLTIWLIRRRYRQLPAKQGADPNGAC